MNSETLIHIALDKYYYYQAQNTHSIKQLLYDVELG